MKRPNILWICTDQQRFDTLGCTGNPFVNTPNLDKLAEEGVLFEHAYCQNPLCTPSRASFLTGRYPHVTKARQNGQSIAESERLLPRILSEAGYNCGLAGKLHISVSHPSVTPIVEPRIQDGYTEFHWSHHPYSDDPIDWPGNQYSRWLRQQGVEWKAENVADCPYVQTNVPASYHQSAWCADRAIEFMENAAAFPDTPWLFSVNIFDPHHPFDPPQEYLDRYMAIVDQLPLPNFVAGELDNKPLPQQVEHHGAYSNPALYPYSRMNDKDHRLIKAAYYAMIDLIDVQVGRMLDALDRTGQRENTIVIFMSDHGEMLGDHGIYLKGAHFYDAAVRVPLIFSMPGTIRKGVRNEEMVELVDLAPTLLDAVSLSREPGMQGLSFWELLREGATTDAHRDDVYSEYYNSGFTGPDEPRGRFATMLRTKQYKLVVHHGQAFGELYDLQSDPHERRNLWALPSYSAIKTELLLRVCDRMAWTVDPLPERVSDW